MTPGQETSEFQLTKLQIIIGVVITLVGAIIEALQQLQILLPDAAWVGVAIMALGVVVKVAATFGYQKSRATVKAANEAASAEKPPARRTI